MSSFDVECQGQMKVHFELFDLDKRNKRWSVWKTLLAKALGHAKCQNKRSRKYSQNFTFESRPTFYHSTFDCSEGCGSVGQKKRNKLAISSLINIKTTKIAKPVLRPWYLSVFD